MTNDHIQTHGVQTKSIDANGVLPGTTFPEQSHKPQESSPTEEPISFPGPDIDGRPTTTTLFTPQQLRQSALILSLYEIINEAFHVGHVAHGMKLLKGTRLRYDEQLFDELGTAPGTFTYIIHYAGTHDVVATASGKRYLGRVAVVGKVNEETRRDNTWKRFGPVPPETAAWELSTMAVDPNLQRRGLAAFLMKLTEEEIKRRYRILADESDDDAKPSRLLTMITTIKERNFDFYSRRGFVEDYETWYEKGWFESENGFTVVNMSKVVELDDSPS